MNELRYRWLRITCHYWMAHASLRAWVRSLRAKTDAEHHVCAQCVEEHHSHEGPQVAPSPKGDQIRGTERQKP